MPPLPITTSDKLGRELGAPRAEGQTPRRRTLLKFAAAAALTFYGISLLDFNVHRWCTDAFWGPGDSQLSNVDQRARYILSSTPLIGSHPS